MTKDTPVTQEIPRVLGALPVLGPERRPNMLFLIINHNVRWGVLLMGEALRVWESGLYGKSPHLPLNFAVNLKLLQKKFYLKKMLNPLSQ